ncbi:MAG: type VI secretion system tip protein TssI/VgrG [Byssovorax sp.]
MSNGSALPLGRLDEHVTASLAGEPAEVISLHGEEGISTLFRFELLCRAEGLPDPRKLVGKEATITIRDGFGAGPGQIFGSGLGAERSIHGVIARAERRAEGSESRLSITVRPAIFPLTLGRGSRVFNDMTVPDIVKAILASSVAAKAETRWNLAESHPVHAYRAQYREDDYSFISRLMEDEGIYFWFDHQGDSSVLVFADSSLDAPDLDGGAALPFMHSMGLDAQQEAVEELSSHTKAAPTRFTLAGFDPENPRFKITAAAGEGPLEWYDAPGGGSQKQDECDMRLRVSREASMAARAGIAGRSSSVRLVPGRVMKLGGHPVSRLDGLYLVTSASYEIHQRTRGEGGKRNYLCRFRGIPQAVPFRAPLESPPARQAGLQTGVVIGPAGAEIYPDAAGRVRVQHHWDREGRRDDRSGKWMRVSQRFTDGSMLLPRIGWNLCTLHEEGAIDAPNVIQRFHDAERPPEYALPDNKTRVVWKTATSPGGGSFNEIYYESRRGAEQMFWNASRDMTVLIKNEKTEQVQRDFTRAVQCFHTLSVALNASEQVKNDQAVTVAANEKLTIGGRRARSVGANEKETIGGERQKTVGSTNDNTVSGTRSLSVATVLSDTAFAHITATSNLTHDVIVGGMASRLTAASMKEDIGKLAVQTIGGDKSESAAKDRQVGVTKALTETVTGAMVLETKADFRDEAAEKSAFVTGSTITGEAPDINVEAEDKIVLRCGGSTITLLPSSVEIQTGMLDLSGAEYIVSVTKRIDHN